jgi:hypothetical protein
MRVLRLLASQPLPCGCLAGVYESHNGDVVALLDARDAQCMAREHREGAAVPVQPPAATRREEGFSAPTPLVSAIRRKKGRQP